MQLSMLYRLFSLKCETCLIDHQEFFAIFTTFGFIGHVQVLVRRKMKIYKTQADESWFCRPRKTHLFPFFKLTNKQLIKLHEK